MRRSAVLAASLGVLGFALSVRAAGAQPATEPANDVAPAATNPPNQKKIWDLAVVFEPSAAHLPQDEIRHAIARELGIEVGGPEHVATRQLFIAAEEKHLIVRFRTPDGTTERLLPLTEDRPQLIALLSLMAGNLARDQRNGLAPAPSAPPEPAPPKAAPPPPAPATAIVWDKPPPAKPEPLYRSHFVGLHAAQDVAFVGGYNICDPKLGQASDNYACFYQGTTDEPFFHTPYPLRDGITNGAVFATTRILVSYDGALAPWATLGGRAGFAIGGGPPAGQRPVSNDRTPEAHAKGTGGTPFTPWHLEVRGSFWFLPLTEKLVRAYAVVGGGIAQIDAKTSVNEYDCEDAGKDPAGNDVSTEGSPFFDPSSPFFEPTGSAGADGKFMADPDGLTPFQQCASGKKTFYDLKNHKPVQVDAWKKLGMAFVEAGVGGVLAFGPNLGLTLETKLLYTLPSTGIVFQPSLGVVMGL
jgi:hypothetical protein